MGKSNFASNAMLNLILSGTPWPNIADNAAASPLTTLYVALHTADPTASGDQSSNECTYTGYARVAVSRGSGWTVASAESSSPLAAIVFPNGTGGTGTATFFSIGTALSGPGNLLYSGAIAPVIVTGNGVQPQLGAASTVTED